MDYVQEELARQRQVLAELMMGREEKDVGQHKETAWTAGEEVPWAEERTEELGPLLRGQETFSQWGWMSEEAPVKRGGETVSMDVDALAQKRMENHRDSVVNREEVVTEVLWVDHGGTSGTEQLSRTFERDARRYDGGFTLY